MKTIDFIPLISPIVSMLGAYVVAKITTKNEIKKIKLSQEHEKMLNATVAYSNMRKAVNSYLSCPVETKRRAALSEVGSFMAYCPMSIMHICTTLENALKNNSPIASDFMERLDNEWQLTQTSQKHHKRSHKHS